MMALLSVVAVLATVFLVLRPNPNEALFWFLVIPAIAANLGYVILSRRTDREYQNEVGDWIEELRSLVGDDDLQATLERDPHFHDYGEEERTEILLALRRQPSSRRSPDSALIETGLDLRE